MSHWNAIDRTRLAIVSRSKWGQITSNWQMSIDRDECRLRFNGFSFYFVSERGWSKRRNQKNHPWWWLYARHFGRNLCCWACWMVSLFSFCAQGKHYFWANFCIISGNSATSAAEIRVTFAFNFWDKYVQNSVFFGFHSEGSNLDYHDGLIYASGLVATSAIYAVCLNQFVITGWHTGMKVRVAICSLIYRKVNKWRTVQPPPPAVECKIFNSPISLLL